MDTDADAHDSIRMLRAIRVIEAVCDATLAVSVSQLAQRVDIPKATLARLVAQLVSSGYLAYVPGKRLLVPGPRAVRFGLRAVGNSHFRRECRTLLRELVVRMGETCNLVALDGDCVMYIERVETDAPLRMHLEPGTRAPLHCTAGGKLLLSQMEALQRNQIIGLLRLERKTPATLVEPQSLIRELDRLKKLGIGEDCEEFVAGMVGVAVAVRADDSSAPVAALVCHAATARASLAELREKLPVLKAMALRIGHLLNTPMRHGEDPRP